MMWNQECPMSYFSGTSFSSTPKGLCGRCYLGLFFSFGLSQLSVKEMHWQKCANFLRQFLG